jgi:hypothetical protein
MIARAGTSEERLVLHCGCEGHARGGDKRDSASEVQKGGVVSKGLWGMRAMQTTHVRVRRENSEGEMGRRFFPNGVGRRGRRERSKNTGKAAADGLERRSRKRSAP